MRIGTGGRCGGSEAFRGEGACLHCNALVEVRLIEKSV